ncbi:MAG: DUF1501 domain-containing protein [Bacteroidia bacterium]
MERRDFIKNSLLASGMFFVPSFLKPFQYLSDGNGYKNLVVIQLSGGNDGLNTIVPYSNDLYYQKRPQLALNKSDVIPLNDALGFHPSMKNLHEIFDNGWMSIMNSVGYPNPDRSHFRSMDIWHSASDSNEYLSSGWIGRYLDSDCTDCKNAFNAIEVDDTLSLAMKGEARNGLAVKNAQQLFQETRDPFFQNLAAHCKDENLNEDNLGYLYKTVLETNSSAQYIFETSKTYSNACVYPNSAFAKDLKNISTFINSGLKTRVYYVSLGGFDTHVDQKGRQEKLLRDYSEGISCFLKDLKNTGKLDDTLVMTFSEFGRRVEQNASNGTDHGTANNVFLMGGKISKKGFYNAAPDLNDLSMGDLNFQIDFRSIYATILDKWLGVNDVSILPHNFQKLDFV